MTLAALALVAGCKPSDDVQVYHAPRDAASEADPASKVPWTVPSGWRTKPTDKGSVRIASYEVTTPDGRSMDVSVIPLPGNSGSILDNVNRWRDQVGLPPITESELASQRQTVLIGTLEGELFEMAGDTPVLDGKFKARTLAALMITGGTTVFFKATGEEALVAENRPKFLAWLASVQTSPAPPPSASAATAAPPAGADMRGPVAPPPSTALPEWQVPPGWTPAAPTTMRLASFVVEGSGGEKGDLSVVVLGSNGGGALANVNRWRGQLSLDPLDDAGLAREAVTLATPAGNSALVVDLSGNGQRILGAIVERGDRAWFYKLTGNPALVGAQREAFLGFVRSVKYP
ncbi:MAG: hypothetical protein KIT22_00850 [Verrucomicrobiae bacterium]|nr:hypothetical protein [Verrucomicrobiae bacterium]